MKLEDIGFYTLSDERAATCSAVSRMRRCELIVTERCNFRCPYCRGLRGDCAGDMSEETARATIGYWVADKLQNIRFSGGEPTLWGPLASMVRLCADSGVERIAVSTNGSQPLDIYLRLLDAGVNDVSVSLDACCSSVADRMAGRDGAHTRVLRTIKWLAARTYVTIGVVLDGHNDDQLEGILRVAEDLGVADVRVIPSAQSGRALRRIPCSAANGWPILRYRIDNAGAGLPVRGLRSDDCKRCRLVLDDSVVAGQWHFPCVIYLREGGNPVGLVGPNMRLERLAWSMGTDVTKESICSANCLDVCRHFNATAERLAP